PRPGGGRRRPGRPRMGQGPEPAAHRPHSVAVNHPGDRRREGSRAHAGPLIPATRWESCRVRVTRRGLVVLAENPACCSRPAQRSRPRPLETYNEAEMAPGKCPIEVVDRGKVRTELMG